MSKPPSLSIIIPVATNETCLPLLLEDLKNCPADDWEILVVTPNNTSESPNVSPFSNSLNISLHTSEPGRSSQMNFGANLAQGTHLLFLHADSRISKTTMLALQESLLAYPGALHYFDLKFQNDGPALLRINEIAVLFRSRIFGLPFGDQGLCIATSLFSKLGGFDNSQKPGEDLRFVLNVHHSSIPFKPVRKWIYTSARKYREQGWLKTTALHLMTTGREVFDHISKPKSKIALTDIKSSDT